VSLFVELSWFPKKNPFLKGLCRTWFFGLEEIPISFWAIFEKIKAMNHERRSIDNKRTKISILMIFVLFI
jgi:hypothetical protein